MITTSSVGTDGRVRLATLDRPECRNALDLAHWVELAAIVRDAEPTGARVLVITGAGTSFCAGADLDGLSVVAMAGQIEAAFRAIRESPIPVVAFVNGAAIGAGAQLAVTCDLRIATPGARFQVPAAELGLPVDPVTTRRLVEIAGGGVARAMLLGCEAMDASRAHAVGLVDRVGDGDEAVAWATRIAGHAPMSMCYLKELLANEPESPAPYDEVLKHFASSRDAAEALVARSERRPPDFHGC